MKKVFLSLIMVALVLTACKSESSKKAIETKEEVKVEGKKTLLNNVDTTASVLNWKGTKPTGSHNGIVNLLKGEIVLENGNLKGGEFVVDMSTITVLDIPADNEGNGKLVGHLTSADFFNIATFPTSKFIITSVEANEGLLNVTGNLTIKDVTKSITIPATISSVGGVTTFSSEKFMVNRADFNVKYASKSFFDNLKDKFIDDLMEMSFVVKTKA
ncbi:YceI family protein [Polaribacter sp.]|uniref:YceI family protein n=1 Tax=Polaribacter sp. TaxID=1920175 RepID=UPI0025FB070D|nr:YceI family protein [Polaribacter sp.]